MNRRSRNNRGSQPRRGGGGGSNRMQVFDSNGPDVRIRGTAWQVHEKYMALAKDAGSAGDRILAENYLQHAEHYQRMINAWALEEGFQPEGRESITDNDEQPADGFEAAPSLQQAGPSGASDPRQGGRREGGFDPSRQQRRRHPYQQRPPHHQGGGNRSNDDLGLPASILGARPVAPASEENARAGEMAD